MERCRRQTPRPLGCGSDFFIMEGVREMRKFLNCLGLFFNLLAALLLYYAFPVAPQIGDTRAVLENGYVVALIPTEHPCFVPLGFLFLVTGFIFQFFAILCADHPKKSPPLEI